MNETIYYEGLDNIKFHPENWLDMPESEMYEIINAVISEKWIKSKTPEYIKFTIQNIYEFVRFNELNQISDYHVNNIGGIANFLEEHL